MIEVDNQQRLDIEEHFDRLFPLNRSLTGEGVRETMEILNSIAKFDIYEVESGTKVFDWIVPNEWNVEEAYIETPQGERIADFNKNNLHLVGYSIPVDKEVDLKELNKHIHSIPSLPKAIPYRTSYYNSDWGFCMTDETRNSLIDGKYHVLIKSKNFPGSMTMGKTTINGTSGREYIISTYSCHPSMTNDNISGMLGWAYLLKEMQNKPVKNTYHFIIGPETIGALTYLSLHDSSRVSGALVMTHLVGPGEYCVKKTFQEVSDIDLAMESSLKDLNVTYNTSKFSIKGSDERQFSSPGFRIPTGLITKPALYEDINYHTSFDSKFSANTLMFTINIYRKVIEHLESEEIYLRTNPYGEPKLGRRNLYPKIGGLSRPDISTNNQKLHDKNCAKIAEWGDPTDALLWVLFYSDGSHSLENISRITNFPIEQLRNTAKILLKEKLIK